MKGNTSRTGLYKVLLHLLGWAVYAVVMVLHNTAKYASATPAKVLMLLPLCAIVCYVALAAFRWMDRHRAWKGLVLLAAFYLSGIFLGYAYVYGLAPAMGVPIQRAEVSYTHGAYLGQLYLFYMRYTGYAALIFLAEKCVAYVRAAARDRATIQELRVHLQQATREGEASDSRLAMHFLGNALQRCYVVMHGVQQQAADAIRRIDALIGYALDVYARRSISLVPLAREVAQLREMMALDRVNTEGGPYVELHLPDSLLGYKVPALTFITCYENVLKHGLVTDPARPAVMRLEIRPGGYRFTVENHVPEIPPVGNGLGGMGLGSVRNRLAAKFGDRFGFVHGKENGLFCVRLEVFG